MAKANRKFQHPMDKVLGIAKIKLIPLSKLSKINAEAKQQKRINKRKLNNAKFKVNK
jgi:hypothetical protein